MSEHQSLRGKVLTYLWMLESDSLTFLYLFLKGCFLVTPDMMFLDLVQLIIEEQFYKSNFN